MSDDKPHGLGYRPALDGVRALAVAAVLAFHGGVAALPGGFLGVDVFFVLSGFLISSLLLAEHGRTGRLALGAFWARRARRLLPALLLVVVAVVAVGRRITPATELPALRSDALAAIGYVANWRMAYRGGDYFTATATASPLQHTWSLGIEEQFYLLWPLVVVVLAARRRLLFGLTLAGVAVSTLLLGRLFVPGAVDRAYYGTDTRAAALLVGAALAVLLAGPLRRPAAVRGAVATGPGRPARGVVRVGLPAGGMAAVEPPVGGMHRAGRPAGAGWAAGGGRHRGAGVWARVRHPVLGASALAGALVIAWSWRHATGASAWLYAGGFLLVALAVAAVLAHAVLSPASPTARLLGLPPLVWLGRISYGVYLWHWPLYGWVDADRTGLTGLRLLAVRLLATLAIALVSYYAVEQPIRTGRLLPRRRLLAPAVATGAVASVVAVAFLATAPPALPRGPAAPVAIAAPTAPAARNSARSASPMLRSGRRPGKEPRITFLGDSVSWSLGTYLPAQPGLSISVKSIQGCGIARLPEIRYIGEPHPNYPGCDKWDGRWRSGVQAADPDLAVILLDRWELMDRKIDGEYRHIGEPEFDAYLNKELDLAVSIARSRGARVALLTAPYTRRAERPDGGLWPEDDPARVDAWNGLLRAAAARGGGSVDVVDLNGRACPDGRFTWSVDNVRLRSDGLHFTPDGVQRWIAPWLIPQLANLAVNGRR
ncbi:acyltransferase family protein [Plantactinospora siamensis]|uniref:Acyltransferase family protein n=1 Tax=Plantactinospora siamensis TaxID=555372 RepID=A0ABV6P272_9ACTN